MVHVVSVQQVSLMARARQQNIFKIPTHSRVMAGRKGRGSEIKSALKSDFCTFS